MSSSTGAPLNLTKPDASEVVSLVVINSNYDAINTNAATVASSLTTQSGQISTLNTAVGSSGAVVKATNVAGGLNRQIPYQSAVNTTAFTNSPAGIGQVLTAGLTTVGWANPIPYKVLSGTILKSSITTGGVAVVDISAAGFTQAPIILLSPIYATTTQVYIASLNSPITSPYNSFTARQRIITSSATTADDIEPVTSSNGVDVAWIAIQVLP